MTIEELKNDPALAEQLEQEMKTLAAGGMKPAEAKEKVLKDHGLAVSEDALQAEAVGKIRLDDAALEQVSGGMDSCFASHSCYAILLHDRNETDQHCWSNYVCYDLYESWGGPC